MVACSRRHGEEIYSEQEIMTLWLHKFEVSRLKPLILTSQRIKRHKSSQIMPFNVVNNWNYKQVVG